MKFSVLLLTLFAVAVFLSSCGATNTEYKSVKDFRVGLSADDRLYEDAVRTMVNEFNRRAGFTALHWETNPSNINSMIDLVDNLTKRNNDNKVGYGQWVIEREEERNCSACTDRTVTQRYSFNVELDKKYVEQRFHDKNQLHTGELMNLFAHEIGHGLTMEHESDIRSIMYSQVGGPKDFDRFFKNVRAFFEVP